MARVRYITGLIHNITSKNTALNFLFNTKYLLNFSIGNIDRKKSSKHNENISNKEKSIDNRIIS